MNEYFNNHYIRTDASGSIIEGWSDGPHNQRKPTEDDILLTDQGGYQFRLFPGGEENPTLYTFDFIPLYKWDGEKVISRTEEEIKAERDAKPAPEPTEMERLRADMDFVLAMEGLL